MTVTTIPRTKTEDEVLGHALALLDWADTLPLPPACEHYETIRKASEGLVEAIGLHGLLRDGGFHPATVYSDLGHGHPDNAMEIALERATQAVREWDRALMDAIGEHMTAADHAARGRAA
jgi:hypothetical protein